MGDVVSLCLCPRCRYFRRYLGEDAHDESSYRCGDCDVVAIRACESHINRIIATRLVLFVIFIFLVSVYYAWNKQ